MIIQKTRLPFRKLQSGYRAILFFLFVSLFIHTADNAEELSYPAEVAETLEKADDNRSSLEKVLNHYASEGDSLKLEAAYYLVGNMGGHCYATYSLEDTAGGQIPLNILDYPDFKSLMKSMDSLEVQYGELDFHRKELIYDIDVITDDFLITQIDYAFKAWREKPWAKRLSFTQFCEYVLPYRGSNEPLENWRATFWKKYNDIESKMTDPSDPLEAAVLINKEIMSWFSFDERYYLHPTDLGISEMLDNRMGRCEDMTNLTIYAMRANGLPVTSDYTPYWANTGNNHAWNAIITPDGRVIPFMGAERNPGEYKLGRKLAKAYRKMFGEQKDNLVFQDRKQEKMPGWLAGKSYIDVTSDYTDVSDVTVFFDRKVPDSVDIAYLCVFNSGEWKAIHWARTGNDSAVFRDMGTDVVYLPALYLNKEIVPFSVPFLLQEGGLIRPFRPLERQTAPVELVSTTHREMDASTEGIVKTFLKSGQIYELFYWNDGWQSLGKKTAGEQPLLFDSAPEGALYWLVAEGSEREERIFSIEGGRQIWW